MRQHRVSHRSLVVGAACALLAGVGCVDGGGRDDGEPRRSERDVPKQARSATTTAATTAGARATAEPSAETTAVKGFFGLAQPKPKPRAQPDATKTFVADSGFRPAQHGFAYENGDRAPSGQLRRYPVSSPGHLNEDGLKRMFGEKNVCLGLEQGDCVLKPQAREFMSQVNQGMNGGQCEGMAVLGLTMYQGLDAPEAFVPGAKVARDIGREEARWATGYYFAYQFVRQPLNVVKMDKRMRSTPNQELDAIIKALGSNDPVVLGFRAPDGRSGHAVVPYAVEDKGNDVFWVWIWDNNWPNAERYIVFDRSQNTWRYDLAATNPEQPKAPWMGGADRNAIYATPISLRLQDAECPFCGTDVGRNLVMVTGGGKATVVDSSGKRIGFDGDDLVNDMPGAEALLIDAYTPGAPPPPPVFFVPSGKEYQVLVHGTDQSQDVAVGIFSAKTALVVDNLGLKGSQTDSLTISADAHRIAYTPDHDGEQPNVRLAVTAGGKSYHLDLSALRADRGKGLAFGIDDKQLSLTVEQGGTATKSFDFTVTRYGADGEKHVVKRQPGLKGADMGSGPGFDFGAL